MRERLERIAAKIAARKPMSESDAKKLINDIKSQEKVTKVTDIIKGQFMGKEVKYIHVYTKNPIGSKWNLETVSDKNGRGYMIPIK